MARLLVILNPVAGRGRGAKIAGEIERILSQYGHQVRLHHTTRKGHAHSLAIGPEAEWADGLVSCGGDGTLSEVVNGRGDRALPVGIVPLGTGNVLAKELGIRGGLSEVLAPVCRWRLRVIDLGELESGHRFTCMVSAGIDGRIMQLLEEQRRGRTMKMWHYFPLAIRALRDADYAPISVRVDGHEARWPAGYACVGNTRSFGGPIEMVSSAECDDGELDVMSCGLHIPTAFVTMIGLAFFRQVDRLPRTEIRRGSEIKLSAHGPRPVPYQVDGEFAGHLPVAMRVLPQSLAVFAG